LRSLITSITTTETVDEYAGKQYVRRDPHRQRSVIVRMTPAGERIGSMVRIDSDPFALAEQSPPLGEAPEVVLGAGSDHAADLPETLSNICLRFVSLGINEDR
jgi:hypothetical protein